MPGYGDLSADYKIYELGTGMFSLSRFTKYNHIGTITYQLGSAKDNLDIKQYNEFFDFQNRLGNITYPLDYLAQAQRHASAEIPYVAPVLAVAAQAAVAAEEITLQFLKLLRLLL